MSGNKWLFAGILCLLGLSLAMADDPAVHPTTGAPLVIDCFRGAPDAIDGDLSDWNLSVMTPAVLDVAGQIYTGATSWTGAADCSGKFYLLWDDEKIYLAVVVKDDKLSVTKSGGDIWNCDCVEVFFSAPEAVATHTATSHYQYGFNANNQKYNWCNMDGAGSVEPTYLQVASSKTPDGYVCEVAIEYAQIRSLDFVAGNAIGFHPVIDDTDDTDREIQITWTGREAHDQTLGFGQIILSAMPAIAAGVSWGPDPEDGATDVPVDVVTSWIASESAVAHDVYFGTSFADVNDASRDDAKGVLASQGQADVQYDPDGLLEYGQTYYWRVDEVNGAPDRTIFKGQTWSFTVEPYAYPVTGITATASSQGTDMGPEKAIDGSGLDADDGHSVELTEMWMTSGDATPWIQFEFQKVCKLHEMWVWNSNYVLETAMGFGARDVKIECSEDGQSWTQLENVPEFAKASGLPGYKSNTIVSFGGVMAKFVKLTVESNWSGGNVPQTGVSEVRFFHVPMQAFGPDPSDGETGVSIDVQFDWRQGREATSHQVFFGADIAAVADGTATAQTVTESRYSPATLDFGAVYFWKVDEIGDSGTYEGDVWSFTSQEYASIDDFESYDDDVDARTTIYDTWVDGYSNQTNGSTVGYMTASGGTFGERGIVHGGTQSMPLQYDNSASPYYSEAERTFSSSQNWTSHGADTLCLWFQGLEANSADGLYVTIKDNAGKSKTVAHTDASATTVTDWQLWEILQSEFTSAGVKMTAVESIIIGVGNRTAPKAGGTGTIYIDDVGYGRPLP